MANKKKTIEYGIVKIGKYLPVNEFKWRTILHDRPTSVAKYIRILHKVISVA